MERYASFDGSGFDEERFQGRLRVVSRVRIRASVRLVARGVTNKGCCACLFVKTEAVFGHASALRVDGGVFSSIGCGDRGGRSFVELAIVQQYNRDAGER